MTKKIKYTPCPQCGGRGEIEIITHDGDIIYVSLAKCPTCKGDRDVPDGYDDDDDDGGSVIIPL